MMLCCRIGSRSTANKDSTDITNIVRHGDICPVLDVKSAHLDGAGAEMFAFNSCSMLCLPLPHKIDDKQSSAKWVAKKKQLTLTMRIVRDH